MRQQTQHVFNKGRGRFACGKPRPLHGSKVVRDDRLPITGAVDNDRHEERLLLGHVVGTFDGELPFVPEIPFEPLLRMLGNNRNEQRAFVNLASDLLVPHVPASQLALIEKDLDAGGTQRLANLLSGLRILRGVA
jgi:hypothetical protein